MNKTITFILSGFLVLSLVGVVMLLVVNNAKTNQLTTLNKQLAEANTSLSQTETNLSQTKTQLKQTKTNLSTAQGELSAKDATISQLESEKSKLQTDKSKLQTEKSDLAKIVNKVFCATTINSNAIESISTNLGLVNLITTTMEDDYTMTSIDTNFDVVWNNSKTAIFTIMGKDDGEKYSYKAVVTWDFDRSVVNSIYDMGQGCYYYLP